MRVALVAGPDPGHLIPVTGLALLLRSAGHDVLVVSTGRWAAALRRDGLAYLPLPLIEPTPGDSDLGHRLHTRAVAMGVPLAALLRGTGLDLIVSDTLTRAGAVAAAALDLPWVELIPHPLADPSVALPPFGTGWEARPRRDRRLAVRTAAALALGDRQRVTALAGVGLADAPPVHRLVTTLPSLEPPRPDWPARTTVVAPPTWEPADVDLTIPPGDGPLLLVVGSTASGRRSVDLLPAVVSAGVEGWRVVSPRFEPTGSALPPWVSAGPGRLAPLLAAADLTVAPGGHGLVAASLRAGVPMVLVPGGGDQQEVAARVVRTGAGLRPGRLRHRGFRRAVGAMLRAGEAARRAGDVAGLPDPVPILEAAAR